MRSLIPPLNDDNNILSHHTHPLPQPDDLSALHHSYSLHAAGNSIPVSVNELQSMYYNQYSDQSFPDSMQLGSYPYSPQENAIDIHYILASNLSHSHNLYDNTGLDTQETDYMQEAPINAQSLEHDHQLHSPSTSSSPTYAPSFHELTHSPVFSTTSSYNILSPAAEVYGQTDAISPSMIHPSPLEPVTDFDSGMHPLNLNPTSRNNAPTDPYAAAFLREQLGEARWSIFSARLCERRLSSSKNKSRSKLKNGDNEFTSSGGGATAIDFLVKVEVVKEVLRTYVPHPYNPLKSLSHAYERSPGGYVTLTRSTVLVLSGWSNTQFSYWARRSEGISVLAVHDHRLRAVALALERRLRAENLACSSLDATQDMLTTLDAATEEQSTSVTGKGLDIIIEEVKKNTGASPFLRGKHSSLDPFGSTNTESDTGIHTSGSPHPHPNVTAPVYMPTFQAMEYTHSPSFALPPLRKRKSRRAGTSSMQVAKSIPMGEGQDLENSMHHFSYPISEPRTMTPESTSSSEIQSVASVSPTFISSLHSHRAAAMKSVPMHHNIEEGGGLIQETENTTREYFPVSDSRSDPEVRSHRKRLSDFSEDDVRKRLKQNE